jgi:2'-5' RNA ligase
MRGRIADLMGSLRTKLPHLRWVSAAQFHLTLRFLGWTRDAKVRSLEPALRLAARACAPGAVPVSGLGLFPDRGRPRVLWLGVSLSAAMRELQAACESAAVAAGFPPEGRPFRSHLTLGRWRETERVSRPALPAVDLGAARVERLVLFRSDLRPSGSVYTPLAICPLGPPESNERE